MTRGSTKTKTKTRKIIQRICCYSPEGFNPCRKPSLTHPGCPFKNLYFLKRILKFGRRKLDKINRHFCPLEKGFILVTNRCWVRSIEIVVYREHVPLHAITCTRDNMRFNISGVRKTVLVKNKYF